MGSLYFDDIAVPYQAFLNDVAAKVVQYLKTDSNDPDFVSQRMAYKIFGRANVERWRDSGLIEAYRRPGKVEYRTADLRALQRMNQDYFRHKPRKQ